MYITYQELINRYDVVATWQGCETIVNSDLIYYAAVAVNAQLASHFAVPFSDAHPTVKDLTLDMAYYKALATRDPARAAEVKDAVIGRIGRIKEGEEYIYTGSGTMILPEGAGQEVWSTTQDYHPVHSMLDAEDAGSVVDPDRLDDLADERD